jgi:hypothetical protein
MIFLDKEPILLGTKIGEHSFSPDQLILEIQERVIDRGCNYAYVRPACITDDMGDYFVKWAKFLGENEIYFHFGYNTGQTAKNGKPSFAIDKETTEK